MNKIIIDGKLNPRIQSTHPFTAHLTVLHPDTLIAKMFLEDIDPESIKEELFIEKLSSDGDDKESGGIYMFTELLRLKELCSFDALHCLFQTLFWQERPIPIQFEDFEQYIFLWDEQGSYIFAIEFRET